MVNYYDLESHLPKLTLDSAQEINISEILGADVPNF